MSTRREAVYRSIDSERDYQERLWGTSHAPLPDAFALYVSEYAARLRAHATDPRVRHASGESVQDFFRKVAGLCVASMEAHGSPHRKGHEVPRPRNPIPQPPLNTMAREMHQENVAKGFYDDVRPEDPRHLISLLGLITTEVAETIEAIRKPQSSQKIPRFTLEEEEAADILIRLLDYVAFRGLNLDGAVEAKRAYNAGREYRHGGKKA